MSDDATAAASTIPLEDDTGASVPLPAELALPAAPAADAPPAGETPPVAPPPPEPVDEEKAGILATLGRERHEAKQLKQFRDQAAPLLIALQKHPDLLAEIQARETGQRPAPAARPTAAPPPPPDSEPTTDDLEQYARDMVLYKADGSGLPDVEAARRILASNDRRVQAAVRAAITQHVAPIQQSLQRKDGQSAKDAIMAFAKTYKADGPELEQMLDGFLASDPSLLHNPQVALSAVFAARGMKEIQAQGVLPSAVGPGAPVGPGQVPPAPMFTERPGARAVAPVAMAPIEVRAAKARNMTPEAWGAAIAPLTGAAKGQHHIILEND